MGSYSQKDKKIYEWLNRLFIVYNIDCEEPDTIRNFYESFDTAADTNTLAVYMENFGYHFEEEY